MQEIVLQQVTLCTEADFSNEENCNNLNILLSKRQNQMQQIEESQQKANVIKEALKQEVGLQDITGEPHSKQGSLPETEQLQKVIKDLTIRLSDIAVLDTKGQHALQDKLGPIKGELKKIQQGKQGQKAYLPTINQAEGFFFDKK
ncbi:MAG: hypothetical protein NUK65_00055 [Firmicutes bacterium]|nr:hypothetical protein [Bacillota bacterium]